MAKDEWRLDRGKAVLGIWGECGPFWSQPHFEPVWAETGVEKKEKAAEAGRGQIMPCHLSSNLCQKMLTKYQCLPRQPISFSDQLQFVRRTFCCVPSDTSFLQVKHLYT